jgi:DNA-binding response OmpR family regulator
MNSQQRKILVVDDEETIVLLFETILSVYNFQSLACKQPENAIKMAVKYQPDLIILDIAMPGKDGYEVCNELKSHAATRKIPVLMVTALALSQDMKKGIKSGADGFIFKPFEPQTVITEIDRLLPG